MRGSHIAISVAVLTLAAPVVVAQRVADEQSRYEAVQHYRAGLEFMSGEQFARAAEEFTASIEKDPLFTAAHYSRGLAYMNLQRYASALQAFQACIEASRQLYALAETNRFEAEKRRDDEIREVRESVRVLNGSGHPLLAIRAEQHLADLERQKTSMSAGFRPPAEALLSLGSAHFRTGDLAAAEDEWKAAIAVNPKLGEAHNNLAVIYMTTGRLKQAEEEVKQAERSGFRVNPQFKEDLKTRMRSK